MAVMFMVLCYQSLIQRSCLSYVINRTSSGGIMKSYVFCDKQIHTGQSRNVMVFASPKIQYAQRLLFKLQFFQESNWHKILIKAPLRMRVPGHLPVFDGVERMDQ